MPRDALKRLAANAEHFEKGGPWDVLEIQRVLRSGAQVDWIGASAFLDYMVRAEGASMQQQVQVAPHVVNSGLLYLGLLRSPVALPYSGPEANPEQSVDALAAALEPHAKKLDKACCASLRGQGGAATVSAKCC